MVARTRRARVTGIGGIFFKAKNPKALLQWYRRHLGIAIEDSVALFTRRGGKDGETGTAYHGGVVPSLHGGENQALFRPLGCAERKRPDARTWPRVAVPN